MWSILSDEKETARPKVADRKEEVFKILGQIILTSYQARLICPKKREEENVVVCGCFSVVLCQYQAFVLLYMS